jgi:putative oxygen-independent coproporphyrinogen III oxidase
MNAASTQPHRATQEGTTLSQLPPLCLYVHFPWCARKCPYCDFNSHESRGEVPEREYLTALIADLEAALPSIWGRRIHTIFMGGGTPSLFSAAVLDELLSAIRARTLLAADAEITLEANPGTFEAQKFADYRAIGINRLSIGIQSFNPRHLQALGRIHDERQAVEAIDIARRHFENFNLDLMYALPSQTIQEAIADIDAAITHGAPHVSAYHLTIEPNTLFHRNPPHVPDDDTAAEMQSEIEVRLQAAGYEHYEISAFAKRDHVCKHNLNYWRFGDYLGIGAGAHSKLSFSDRIVREMRHKHPAAYMKKAVAREAIQERHEVARKDLPFEFAMNALRLADGFPIALFQERTGLSITAMLEPLKKAERDGLITRDHVTIAPTSRGQRFLNELLQLFLPA